MLSTGTVWGDPIHCVARELGIVELMKWMGAASEAERLILAHNALAIQ